MHTYRTILAMSGSAMLLAGTALADQPATLIDSLPDKGTVTVSGTVEQMDSAREFRLHDDSGSVDVKLASGESAVLKQGDSVTVTGTVEKPLLGLMGKDIVASNVQVHKSLSSALSDAITSSTGISLQKAETTQINQLPKQGMVRLIGTVQSVSGAKAFTLKDPTGTIDVSVQSSENAALAKGAEVSVIGYVKSGILGKHISATHVTVMADADTAKTGSLNPSR